MVGSVRRLAGPLLVAAVVVPVLAASQARKGSQEAVKRGEYLVRFGGCHECHTPWRMDPSLGMPAPDMSRALSGHPADAPGPASSYVAPDAMVIGPTNTSFRLSFGTVYAANLTPHETGMKAWTEEQFLSAMRTGSEMGIAEAHPIMPPMPWTNLAGLTDEDLRAIFAYLRSVRPIANAVPEEEVDPKAMEAIRAANAKLAAAMGPKGAEPAGSAGGKPAAKPKPAQ